MNNNIAMPFWLWAVFSWPLCCFQQQDGPAASRTLDLASALEVGSGGARPAGGTELNNYNSRSVLTIAFQFTFENHMRDNVAAMARQYVRSVVGSVQRVAMAIAPSRLSPHAGPKPLPGSPEALTLARWISRSYRFDSNLLCSVNFIFQMGHFSLLFCFCVDNSVVCFRIHTGGELLRADSLTGDALLKQLWHHSDAITCCSLKTNVIHLTKSLHDNFSR